MLRAADRTCPEKLDRFEVEDFASCGLVQLPLGRKLPRGNVPERAVRPVLIVVPLPLQNLLLRVKGTYGHLEPERRERRVDLDSILAGVQPRPPASTILDAGGPREDQLRDIAREEFMVEGKGFEPSTSALRT
ncbi:MAG TPA: hypothetical protein VFM04_09250, partial [Candidatus Methylomirabilis sp.]|nr:hypothetical protein [Candidatus Methylomirabilis sp.]